ncbi:hypothetical protein [Thermobifida cellulosilytica]|uniref:Uncharacterized protein n=1 Tax=Thermobifida cellulosilytica TB100 TaxID=665004 RepID=A0A147KD56_THECS|nr:hypothetical protein [Thermobifida cellulosilytica]KUP95235.1 hypothetical protein AC529_18835 [Thermobifida cellulosilytica TB100]
MLRWLRRHSLPSEIRARLALEPGERVIAHALTGDRTAAVVATTAAVHLPDGRRVPWERVDHAGWNDVGLTLTVEDEPELVVPLPAPGRLAQAVYERVTATILVSRHVPLLAAEEGSPGVRLVARRSPGGSEVTWRLRYDEGVDPDSAEVRERTALALARLREQMGI